MKYVTATILVLLLTASAAADTVEQYLEKIDAARGLLITAKDNDYYVRSANSRLLELADVNVVTGDGEVVNVHNEWVTGIASELLGENRAEAAARALKKLDAITEQVKSIEGSKALPVEAGLPDGDEFQEGAQKPTMTDKDLGIRKSLRDLSDWLSREQLEKIRESDNQQKYREESSLDFSAGTFTIAVIVLVGLVLLFIAFQIVRGRRNSQVRIPRVMTSGDGLSLDDALKRTPEQWKELAREFFEKGDYTQALRALYLSLLVILHRKRLISYDKAKTNWEYVWEVNPAKPEYKPFQALTAAFDFKWYGRLDCTREDYLALEELADTAVIYRENQA